MESWLSDLEKEIKQQHVKPQVVQHKTRSRISNSWLVFPILLLSAFLAIHFWPEHVEVESPEPEPKVLHNELAESLESLSNEINTLKPNVKELKHKLSLLGIISNNNFAALKHDSPDDVIYIDTDWTIGKMPTKVRLDDKTLDFLESCRKH